MFLKNRQMTLLEMVKILVSSIFFLFHIKPLPDDKILNWSKLKQIADDILKYI